ncbi:MAG: dethiobiotin synthetase [Flavobacteriales bacterium]|jgi:dethiobiotin synthetase
MSKHLIVSGIGTEVGKTVAAAIIAEALGMDYWKPIQAGDLENTDSHKVASWISNPKERMHPEAFRLNIPASPHYSAELDGITIQKEALVIPESHNRLLIEGAGGLMVPINQQETLLDVFADWQIPVILVSRHYLGSINHTLMSIQALKDRNIPIAGILFNGEENLPSEEIIEKIGGVHIIGRVDQSNEVNAQFISEQAQKLKEALKAI